MPSPDSAPDAADPLNEQVNKTRYKTGDGRVHCVLMAQ